MRRIVSLVALLAVCIHADYALEMKFLDVWAKVDSWTSMLEDDDLLDCIVAAIPSWAESIKGRPKAEQPGT